MCLKGLCGLASKVSGTSKLERNIKEVRWMEETLHQLIGGKHPTISRVSTILLVQISQPSTVSPRISPISGTAFPSFRSCHGFPPCLNLEHHCLGWMFSAFADVGVTWNQFSVAADPEIFQPVVQPKLTAIAVQKWETHFDWEDSLVWSNGPFFWGGLIDGVDVTKKLVIHQCAWSKLSWVDRT